MKKNEFHIKHSELLQECMHMEDALRGHYGLIKSKRNLDDYAKYTELVDEDTLGQLIDKLKKLNGQYSESFIKKLEKAKEIRNYYAHRIFYHHSPFNHDEVKLFDEKKIIREYRYINKINDELDIIYQKKRNKTKGKNEQK